MKNIKNINWRVVILPFILTGIVFLCTFSEPLAGEFDDFKTQHQQDINQLSGEFDLYSDGIDNEFNTFKKIVREEYNKYKKRILTHWNDAKISDKKRWIEYTSDFRNRKIVDFENEIIELDIIVSKDDNNVEKKIHSLLSDLILEDQQTAFKRDPLSQGIEKRINRDVTPVNPGTVEKTPILTTVITGSPDPSKQELEKAVSDLKENSSVERKPSKIKNADVVNVKIPLPSEFLQKKAMEYKPDIDHYANKHNIDDALLFAVIHTESAFNPMARSHVPAYGLMQIVPQSAGIDASEVVFGEKKLLTPSYLYNGKNNINIGTTYIFIIFNRYLKKITDHESRLYCTIAAYNTGVGNVARAFTGTKNINKAKDVINTMSPQEVYDTLLKNLPYDETKHYLKRVSRRIDMYRGI